MRRLIVLTAAALTLTAAASEAAAHARLVHSDPRRGAVVSAPKALRLTFSEKIVAKESAVTVTGPKGPVAVGRLALDPKNPHLVIVPMPAVPPGTYKVDWTMKTEDTHTMRGDFAFSAK